MVNITFTNHFYKLRIIKLFYKVVSGEAPAALSHLVKKASISYSLRRNNNIVVPRFNSYFLKNSIGGPSFEMLFRLIIQDPNFRFSFEKWRMIIILRSFISVLSRFSRSLGITMILNVTDCCVINYFYSS